MKTSVAGSMTCSIRSIPSPRARVGPGQGYGQNWVVGRWRALEWARLLCENSEAIYPSPIAFHLLSYTASDPIGQSIPFRQRAPPVFGSIVRRAFEPHQQPLYEILLLVSLRGLGPTASGVQLASAGKIVAPCCNPSKGLRAAIGTKKGDVNTAFSPSTLDLWCCLFILLLIINKVLWRR